METATSRMLHKLFRKVASLNTNYNRISGHATEWIVSADKQKLQDVLMEDVHISACRETLLLLKKFSLCMKCMCVNLNPDNLPIDCHIRVHKFPSYTWS